jgi:hypothetical protein
MVCVKAGERMTIPAKLQGGIDALQALRTQREDVRQHLGTARDARDQQATKSDADLGALAEAEASAILDHTREPSKQLRERVRTAQEQDIILGARVRGLEARDRKFSADIDQAKIDLDRAETDWCKSECDQAETKIRDLAGQFINAIAEPLAIGRALGSPRIDAMMRHIVLTSLGSGRDLALPVTAAGWRGNPQMLDIADAYSAVITACQQAMKA